MSAIPELLSAAAAWHQSGQIAQAVEAYQRVLAQDPRQAEALVQLGLLAFRAGQLAPAAEYLTRAAATAPEDAGPRNFLGVVLASQGHAAEAEAAFRAALRLRPGYAEAHTNLGNVLRGQGRLAEAEAAYRMALQLRPDLPEAHNNFGNVLMQQRRPAEAEAAYREALRLRPDYVQAHNNLGNVLREQKRLAEAQAAYREALRLQPGFVEARTNLGVALMEQGQPTAAEAEYRAALRLRPDYPEAHLNLGNVLRERERPDEAEAAYRAALQLRPDFADAHNNLGMLLVSRGQYPEGWAECEWRWRTQQLPVRHFRQPLWDGTPLAGKTILLYPEQGLGDTLQFIRYAALLKRTSGTVLVECHRSWWPLLQSCPGVDACVSPGVVAGRETVSQPQFDVQAPLMSLPHLCRTTLATVPAEVPYLFPDPDLVRRWQERLRSQSRNPKSDGSSSDFGFGASDFLIGIAWQGSLAHPEQRRFMPLRSFAPLAAIPGICLVSLQKGANAEQLATVADGMSVADLGPDVDETTGTFMDTAAVMKNLDLVVSADTAVAHLAGALGVPVWIALCDVPNFRWLLGREDSPWYPSLRLFRQPRPGDWGTVFERMAEVLRASCGSVSRPITREGRA